MLAWVTSTGRVDLASISRNESKVLGHHSDSRVSLLKFSPSDALLLTADNSGHIKVFPFEKSDIKFIGLLINYGR